MRHLSEEQLIAFRDGESDDPGVREHLLVCDRCQQAFDDSRWSLALQRLVEHGAAEHPPREQLLAFWDNALSEPRASEIQRHLRGCDRCLALYGRLRSLPSRQAWASPGARLVRSVRRRLRRGPVRPLGEVVLARLGDVLRLLYQPAGAETLDVQSKRLAATEMSVGPVWQSMTDTFASDEIPHPSSARARRSRASERITRRAESEAAEEDGDETGSEPVSVDAGELRLELAATRRGGRTRLEIRAVSKKTGKPERGVAIRLRTESGQRAKLTTDERGRAGLPYPGEPSRLELGEEHPVELLLYDFDKWTTGMTK